VMVFLQVEKLMSLKEPSDKTRIFRNLLKGQALSYFEHHLKRSLEAEDSQLPDNDLIKLVIRELFIGLEYISKRAICMQNYYMRQPRALHMGINTFVR
jgi:hypothetical protein